MSCRCLLLRHAMNGHSHGIMVSSTILNPEFHTNIQRREITAWHGDWQYKIEPIEPMQWNWMEIASQQSNSTKHYLSLSSWIIMIIIMNHDMLWLVTLVICDMWLMWLCLNPQCLSQSLEFWNRQIMQWTAELLLWKSERLRLSLSV